MELSQTVEKRPVGSEIWHLCGLRSSECEEGSESWMSLATDESSERR